jgi:hypothetical protein
MDGMGRAYSIHGRRGMPIGFRSEIQKETDHWKKQDADGRII